MLAELVYEAGWVHVKSHSAKSYKGGAVGDIRSWKADCQIDRSTDNDGLHPRPEGSVHSVVRTQELEEQQYGLKNRKTCTCHSTITDF
uniref:Uncharacterized protein n=1 Tax=Arundo donax TaxID=35708 RepID=A0A0A9DIZ7_ARUDO